MDVTTVGALAVETVKFAANPTGYLISQIAESTSRSIATTGSAKAQELAELRLQAERQEIEMRMAEAQAKVAQELAIAKRIENAAEVEIEEFYEYGGDAKAGLRATATSVAAELSGSGKRVSRRVYRFKSVSSPSSSAPGEA
jgi:hypothetical protein